MEAATPLRHPRVTALLGAADHRERSSSTTRARPISCARGPTPGTIPPRVVADAIEIGARVLDREQAGASVEILRQNLEHASKRGRAAAGRDVRGRDHRAAQAARGGFGPDSGHVTRVLARHFGAESSTAVQHQVRAAVAELLNESREKLFKQFSSADESNPLATFQKAAVAAIRQSSDQQHAHLREMSGRMGELQLADRRSCRPRRRRRSRSPPSTTARPPRAARTRRRCSTPSTRSPRAQGDDCDAVGDLPRRRRAQGRRAGRDRRLRRPAARPDRLRGQELAGAEEGARRARRGDGPARRRLRASGSSRPRTSCRPARSALREVNGDKLFVVFDPEDGSRLALEVAYSLARARVLMAKGDADGLDATALRAEVERALGRDGGRAPDQAAAHARRQRHRGRPRRAGGAGPPRRGCTSGRSTRCSRRLRGRRGLAAAARRAGRAWRSSRRARRRARSIGTRPAIRRLLSSSVASDGDVQSM